MHLWVSTQDGGVRTVQFHVQKGPGVQAAMLHVSVLTGRSVTLQMALVCAQQDGEEHYVTSPVWLVHTSQ